MGAFLGWDMLGYGSGWWRTVVHIFGWVFWCSWVVVSGALLGWGVGVGAGVGVGGVMVGGALFGVRGFCCRGVMVCGAFLMVGVVTVGGAFLIRDVGAGG